MFRALKGLLVFSLLSCPFIGSAQNWSPFPGILQRLEVGYSFLANTATYETHDKIFNDLAGINLDTTIKSDVKTKGGFGVSLGTYFPLKRLGHKSSLALSVSYLYNAMLWDFNSSRYLGGLGGGEYNFSGATAQMCLPIGLDFKFGCDAITNKRVRFCTTFGAGVMTSYSTTTMDGSAFDIDPAIGVAPYVKFETGIFAGICWKVRALYSYGSIPYIDYKKSDFTIGEITTGTKMTGKSNLTLSVVIMPFAFTWKKSEWFNSY